MTAVGGLILGVIVLFAGLSVVYGYRGQLKRQSPYVYYGSILGVVILGIVVFYASVIYSSPSGHVDPTAGVSVDQSPGRIDILIVTVGNIDWVEIVGPDGTRSVKVNNLSSGARFELRSNEEVINFLNDPENNITVPTLAGTKTIESIGDLPPEYQRTPDGFVDPDADIGSYDNASVATVACLYRNGDDFEIGRRRISAGVSIPCNTPVLAQNDLDQETLGTNVEHSSEPNKGKTLTSPVILRNGEYQLFGAVSYGTVKGQETIVQSVRVTDAHSGKMNNTVTEVE